MGLEQSTEPTDPYFYALGDRVTVWDGEMKGIQMALEGAEKENAARERVTIAVDTRAAISAVDRIVSTGRAITAEGRAIGSSIQRLTTGKEQSIWYG